MKKVTGNRLQVTIRRIIQSLFILFLFLYPIPYPDIVRGKLAYTLYPAHADVNIGEKFGFGDIKSVGDATNKGIPTLFTLLAAIVVIYFVWGAFKFILSRGNKEEVAEARGMITHAIIGFIILIFIFFILQFLLNSLFGVQFSIIGT